MEPVKLLGMDEPHEPHVNLNKLVRLSDREVYEQVLQTHQPESHDEFPNTYPPDFQVLCFDFLYWASVLQPYEWETDFSPGWKIARHFRWSPKLLSIGNEYVRRLLAVPAVDPIPPFITVHVRHSDFGTRCRETNVPLDECFAPLDAYAVRVREVQVELEARPALAGHGPFKVIVISDEPDPAWWAEVSARGWLHIDHSPAGEDTDAKHGVWYTALIDMVTPTLGMGFVGTEASTMSMHARRRVEEWNGGVTRTVKWGRLGADDH
ncbi:hypothetical protein HWV62_40818 [Athelia sp. TMB]|nr:hypothetical protein HWV62_40818 [Athelia sp. TMB]